MAIVAGPGIIAVVSRADRELRRAIADVIGTDALPREVVVHRLVQGGVDLGAESDRAQHRLDRLLQDDPSFSEVSAGLIHVPSMLEGTSWTVHVDPDDAAKGFVRTHPHLTPLGWWLIGGDVALVDADGAVIGTIETDGLMLDGRDTDVVIGPDGWLDGLAGAWATVSVVDGALRWDPCPSVPDPTAAQIEALRTGFDHAVRTESVEMFDESPIELRFASGDNPVHEALVADRAAFLAAAVAPLPQLYRAAGLSEQMGIIAAEDFDWGRFRSWQNRNRLRVMHRLDGDQAERLALLLGACRSVVEIGADALGADAAEREDAALLLRGLLEDGQIAGAFWVECDVDADAVPNIGRFVDELAGQADERTPVGLAWLRARCLDRSGEPAAAVATLEAAVTADCDHLPSLLELAGFCADRGEALLACRLLQQAGVLGREHDDHDDPDEADHLVAEVEGFRHRPREAAKRNDRCPCGSGRKYKACHLGRERHQLDDRAGWLYLKAQRFLRQRKAEHMVTLALEMAEPMDAPGAYRRLRHSPVLMDLALHEDGVFADFLAARDSLLPDDEALLAAQWALVDRGVFEVEHVHGERLELRDIGRGERVTVTNVHPNARTKRGTLLLGRPLPVGESYRAYSGFIQVDGAVVADLLDAIEDGDASEIAALLGESLRPPRLSNTDGEDLMLHTLRWRITDPAAIDGALRAAGLQADDRSQWRLVRDTTNMANATIATLCLDGEELVGDVNSDRRSSELRALVASATPDAELVADDTRPIEEALEDVDPDDAPEPFDQRDPELRRAIEEFIVEHEQRWLDEPIPALGGSTPRAAAADPVGREQLVRLLDSFPGPSPDSPGTFDPDRLRQALGL